MKRITHNSTARDRLLHIETDGCIVNIRVGLHDAAGQAVTSIEILPNTSEHWKIDGHMNNRVIRKGG